MRFVEPFLKLPIRFDAEMLEREVRALPTSSWVPHPTGFAGNEAVRLVTAGGGPTDDFDGPMGPTEDLQRCPYISEIMAELDGVWTRSRLMGLGPGAEVPKHIDSHYHWRTHLRIHIPVITDRKVEFTCGDETLHMAAGECWVFDSFRWHAVRNGWTERRVHLVLDTVMTQPIRDLIDVAQNDPDREPRYLVPGTGARNPLKFEKFNVPYVMSPWELRCHIAFIAEYFTPHPKLPEIRARLERLEQDWAALWAQFGPCDQGVPDYARLLAEFHTDLTRLAGDDLKLTNGVRVRTIVESLIVAPALAGARPTIEPAAPDQRLAS